jgi:hypothetical protein
VPPAFHRQRRRILHRLCLSLARHAGVALAGARVVQALDARDRLGRVAALFTFVSHLAGEAGPSVAMGELRDGVDVLVRVAGEEAAPAVLLAALLKSVGERAQVDYARDLVFVRVEIEPRDAARLPPHAALVAGARGRIYLPLWVRHARSPMGFLPRPARDGLARRRFIA